MNQREPVYCDCCGKQVMGYRIGGRVVWYNESHGVRHTVAIALEGLDKPEENEKDRVVTGG